MYATRVGSISTWTRRLAAVLFTLLASESAYAQLFAPVAFDHADSTRITEIRAQVQAGHGSAADSSARVWVADIERRFGRESLEVAGALALVIETIWATSQQTGDLAMEIAERQRDIRARVLGREHADYGAAIYTIGNLFLARGDYPTADSLLMLSLEIRKLALGEDHSLVGGTHARIAYIKRLQTKYEEALFHSQRALAIQEKAKGAESAEVATALTSLGNVYMRMGKYEEAKQVYLRGHPLWLKHYASDASQVANSLQNISWIEYLLGNYSEARRIGEEALAIRETTLKDDRDALANLLSNVGLVDWALGDFDRAEERLLRSLAIHRELNGPDHPQVLQDENNTSVLYKTRGDYAKALELAHHVRSKAKEVLGVDHPEYAANLELLGAVYLDTGDYARAEEVLTESLEARRRSLGPEHPLVSYSLDLFAETRRAMGKLEGVRAMLEEAIAIREQAGGVENPELCPLLSDLASVLSAEGDRRGARRALERSLAIEERLPQASPELGLTLVQLSRLDRAEGKTREAEQRLLRALAVREQVFGQWNPIVGSTCEELAGLYFARGDGAQALTNALRAERIGREHLRVSADAFSEEQLLKYAAVRPSGHDVLLSLLADQTRGLPDDAARRVWDELVLSRALVFDAVASRRHPAEDATHPELADLARSLSRATTRYANLLVHGDTEDPVAYRKLLADAQLEREQAEHELSDASAAFRERLTQSRAGLDAVQAGLPPNVALAGFWRYEHVRPGVGGPEAQYVAMVLAPGRRDPEVLPIGTAGEVEARVQAWRTAVAPSAPPGAARGYATGDALRKLVWDNVSRSAGPGRDVFLVPDGVLHLVSWLGLPTSPDRYLCDDDRLVFTLSTERDLLEPAPVAVAENLLALGGVDFDADPASNTGDRPTGINGITHSATYRGAEPDCPEFRSIRFEALPATQREVDEVAGIWARARTAGQIERMDGGAASETRFKQSAAKRSVLHLATHGFFLGEECSLTDRTYRGIGRVGALPDAAASADALADPTRSSLRPLDLRLAGLALAGANRRERTLLDQDDGILTAEEIAALDLSSTRWAVLSACDTGLGEVTAGEGILGLRRAFQAAGARTVVMSLWPVEDEAARGWMAALYRAHLEGGLGTAEAVRAATRERLQELRRRNLPTTPSSWAGFVAAGDWR